MIYYSEYLDVFSVFWLVWSAKCFFSFFSNFGKIAAHGGIFFQLSQRLRSSGRGDDRACYVFRHGGGRKTALLIRILGRKVKTVSLLFGEPYVIQLIPLVPARPLAHSGVETHTHTLIPHTAQMYFCL